MIKVATAAEARKFIPELADGLTACKVDGTPHPAATAAVTAWLLHRASLDDEALAEALS